MDKKVNIESSLGTLTVYFDSATHATVSRGSFAKDDAAIIDGRAVHFNAVLSCVDGVWGIQRTDAGNESRAAISVFDLEARAHTNSIRPWRVVRDAVVEAVSKWAAAHPQLLLEVEAQRSQDEALSARARVAELEKKLAAAKDALVSAEEKRVAAMRAAGLACEPAPMVKPPLVLDEETTQLIAATLMQRSRADDLRTELAFKLYTVAAYINGLEPTITVKARKE